VHLNYFRGETRVFVGRRERFGHLHYHKGRNETFRWYKSVIHRENRRRFRLLLNSGLDPELWVPDLPRCIRYWAW
jgi:hypothetical protein